MKMNLLFKSVVVGIPTAVVISFTLSFSPLPAQQPVEDVFRVMDNAQRINDSKTLWPGFDITTVPLLVCDSIDTWLFFMEEPLEGFVAAKGHPGVWYYKGQHPLVRGNSIVRVGDRWVATSLLSGISRRTGEKYGPADLAGIIIHEQFHIFQRLNHPNWMQNDGVLLIYPPDNERSLLLRRMEKEAFSRAVVSENLGDMCGWAREALDCRRLRMDMVDPAFRDYERELQRTEGISDYIEKTARNLDPLNAAEITNGIAPAGVRDMGYVEGRWIAMLLDRLYPEWKNSFESNGNIYLDDLLMQVLAEKDSEMIRFTDSELEHFLQVAGDDLKKSMERKNWLASENSESEGFTLEIDAISRPLSIRIFEPLEFDILEDGSLFHRLIFAAANEAGSLRVMNQPCFTWLDKRLGVERVVINGLEEMPDIIDQTRRIVVKNSNMNIDLKYTGIMIEDSIIRIEL